MADNIKLIENYVYLYHTDTLILIPSYPQQINDNMNVSYQSTTPLARTAPMYSYSGSGPRTLQITLNLHRDMMNNLNYKNSKINLDIGDDYVDTMIKQLQAAALPEYSMKDKMINPPIVAVRFGDDIFCKGVVSGGVSLSYSIPIIEDKYGNSKYAIVNVTFTLNEIEPYDATTVMQAGSFRGLDTTLERNIWKKST